jgi:hypothetical protein
MPDRSITDRLYKPSAQHTLRQYQEHQRGIVAVVFRDAPEHERAGIARLARALGYPIEGAE